MLDLKSEVAELRDELLPAVERVLMSGQFVGGDEVEAFERRFAERTGVRHAVGLNSGTDALILGLEALGVGPGDEVVTTPFSFFATSEAVLRVGATPVFADIDDVTLNLDPAAVERVLTPRTRALLPVHLFGLPVSMAPLMAVAEAHGLVVLEDCAQAFGANVAGEPVGSIGDVGAFSFYPTKNLGAYGDAGLATTNDDDVAYALRSLRNHGSTPEQKYVHERIGHNSRLDALQAAILSVKLGHVDEFNARRRERASAYRAALAPLPQGAGALRLPVDDPEHVYHQFTVRLPRSARERAERELAARGVAFSRFYPVVLSTQPEGADHGRMPVAELAAEETVSLPIHPWLPDEAIAASHDALAAALLG